jgi:hypothetical protein
MNHQMFKVGQQGIGFPLDYQATEDFPRSAPSEWTGPGMKSEDG